MPATVDIPIPAQGAQANAWKEIFLGNDGDPKFFTTPTTPTGIANNIIVILLVIATIAAIIYLIMSAWLLTTSGGDSEKYTKAKTGLVNTVIGIVVLVAMWALIAAIRTLARGTIG